MGTLLVELAYEGREAGDEGIEGEQGIFVIDAPAAPDARSVEIPGQSGQVELLD